MGRVRTNIKIHEVHGPRLPCRPIEVEVQENEYAYLAISAIAIPDGEGKIFWIDTIVTTDGGTARIYDETSAAGETLSGGYAAKAVESRLKNYDPPLLYKHGVYATISNAVVRICYKPFARNLRCTVSPIGLTYKNLVTRVSVVHGAGVFFRNDLKMRVEVLFAPATKDLVSRVTTLQKSTKSLVSRVTSQRHAHWPLAMQVTVHAI